MSFPRTRCSVLRSVLIALPLVTLACGSGSSASVPLADASVPLADAGGGNAEESGLAAPGQLGLRVEQARQHRAGTKADSEFLVAVTLANGKGGAPVPLTAAFFKLRVKSGLLKTPSVASGEALWVDGKTPDMTDLLAGGASFGPWILSFSIDASTDVPVELTFEAPSASLGDATVGDARKATAAVTLEKCTECREPTGTPTQSPSVCTYLDRDLLHCGACTVVDGSHFGVYGGAPGSCSAGVYTCSSGTTACATDAGRADGNAYMGCFDLANSVQHCGKCETQCNGSCAAGKCSP